MASHKLHPEQRRFGLWFTVIALLCLASSLSTEAGWVQVMAGIGAINLGILALAYLRNDSSLLGKRAAGSIAWPAFLLLLPYHIMNGLLLRGVRIVRRKPVYHEVVPGLILGERLLRRDCGDQQIQEVESILDVTAEFEEVRCLREQKTYLCLPLLDACAPSQTQLKRGVDWISERIAGGKVYVHCASGNGRRALFVAAYLLASARAETADAAIQTVKLRRPSIGLQKSQFRALHAFAEQTIDERETAAMEKTILHGD